MLPGISQVFYPISSTRGFLKMHDVWMCCMDDAWTGAMTDKLYNVWMGGMYTAWTGAMTDIPYHVWTDGDFTRISCR